jgi:hypothetical protein
MFVNRAVGSASNAPTCMIAFFACFALIAWFALIACFVCCLRLV